MAKAILICFSAAVMTVSKTVLYCKSSIFASCTQARANHRIGMNEYFSSYQNVGHNDWSRLVLLWIIPNGAWLVVPSYMIYVLGGEIISGMELAGRSRTVKDE